MPTSLVVPVALDAVSINQQLLSRDTFRVWDFDYLALTDFDSPEPLAVDGGTTGPQAGIMVHWSLPDGLRHGSNAPDGSGVTYPLVPNRWLITRFIRDTTLHSTAWVVESDCPNTDAAKDAHALPSQHSQYLVDPSITSGWATSGDTCRSSYQVPDPPYPPIAELGAVFPRASWEERTTEGSFLTALAPANPSFCVYTPHNLGIFSFFDDMAGVADDVGTVSYSVVGWYGAPGDDPLAGAGTSHQSYAATLDGLDWTVVGPSAKTSVASSTLFQGLALGVEWDPSGQPPSVDDDPLHMARNSGALDFGMANNGPDALLALLAARPNGLDAQLTTLLRAFQYDLLPLLNQPDGDALLRRAIAQQWYSASAGGYRWEVVPAEGSAGTAVGLTAGQLQRLNQLNADQQSLDTALGTLYGLQWRLFELWWKAGKAADDDQPDPEISVATLQDQLDPTYVDPHGTISVAAAVLAAMAEVRRLASAVPQPDPTVANPQQALIAGTVAFAESMGLDSHGCVLKAVEAPRYWMPNDPVVVVSGVAPPAESSTADVLPVRVIDDVRAELTVDGATIGPDTAPHIVDALPSPDGLPAHVQTLLFESVVLDPSNAHLLATALNCSDADASAAIASRSAPAFTLPLPGLGLDEWVQPWEPMFLEWQVQYTPLPEQDTDGKAQWAFDGTDYHFAPESSPDVLSPQRTSGIAALSPHTRENLQTRLHSFLANDPDPQLSTLQTALFGAGAEVPVVTQALSGFNAQLAGRDQRAMCRPDLAERTAAHPNQPTYSMAELMGFSDGAAGLLLAPRYRGAVTTAPFIVDQLSQPFQYVRRGQCTFEYLSLYDKFGRALIVVDDSEGSLKDPDTFPAVVDDALKPRHSALPDIATVVEVPTRILQPSRVDFDLVDAATASTTIWQNAASSPLCGWLLPNHLDRALLLFAAEGSALGEVRLTIGADGAETAHWSPPPHGTVQTLADLAAAAPDIAGLVTAPQLAAAGAFRSLLDVVDATLWTTDALATRRDESLAVLIGRPLALVRARLQLTLQQPPWHDTSWTATFAEPQAGLTTVAFPVRLGEEATRDDGLIGYFGDEDYRTFYSVADPGNPTVQTYVQPIGSSNYPLLQPDGPAHVVTMLMDPRASVTATTGIVPAVSLSLPTELVVPALKQLEVGFRVGPALTSIRPTPTVKGRSAPLAMSAMLSAPIIAGGSWTLWDSQPVVTPVGVTPPSVGAEFTAYRTELRDGWLQQLFDLS